MRKRFFVFMTMLFTTVNTYAVNNYIPKKFNTVTSYNDVYPYRLNNTKTNTNAKDISAAADRRSVVPRSNIARASSNTTSMQPRRVVQRSNTNVRAATNNNAGINARAAATAPVRVRSTNTARNTSTTYYATNERPSSQRCMADYKECMEDYCKREDTPYNRCFCSAKLAQIDSRYQPKIDSLIQQIIKLQYNTDGVTSDEIKSYWDKTIGSYTGTNPWTNIDNALNIKWADAESRVRGQNAFNIGHQYCVNFLRACSSMASNLRDAYKSEITRDCSAYESSLQKIQNAAESVIESYHD